MNPAREEAVRDDGTAAFFADPPWRGGVSRYRMGLAAIPLARWLPDDASEADVARKQALYTSHLDDVLRISPGAGHHVDRLVETLRAHLSVSGRPSPEYPRLNPFAQAALWVPDDLCLMVAQDGGWKLAAACLCAPSYWRLADKLGQDLTGLHAGHAGLNALLGLRMQEVFDRLPQDRILERRNWFLHGPGALFEPLPRKMAAVASIAGHTLRTERQTLRRLDTRCVVFTIRVRLIAFEQIRHFPRAAADMAVSVRAMTSIELQAFHLRDRIDDLLYFLDGIAEGID